MSAFRFAVWDLSGRIINYLVLFATSVILTRILDPADYGAFGIVISVFAISAVFLDLGFRAAIVQAEEISQAQLSTVFYINFAIAAAIATGIMAASGSLESFYSLPGLSLYLSVTSLAFVLNGLTAVPSGVLQRSLKFKEITIINVIAAFISSIAAIVCALYGLKVWSLIASQLVNALALMAGCFIGSRWFPTLTLEPRSIKPLWKYGSNLFGSALLDTTYSRLDGFIIPKLFGIVTFGFYSRGQSLDSTIRSFYTSTISSVVFPLFSRNQTNPKLDQLYLRILNFVSFVTVALSGVFVVTAHELIVILFSEKWVDSVGYFRIISLSTFIFPVSAIMVYLIAAKGNSRLFLRLEVLKKVLLTPAYLMFFVGGVYAFLVALTVSNLACLVANIIFTAREIGVSAGKQIRDIFTYVAIAGGASSIAFFTRTVMGENNYSRVFAAAATYALSYLALNYLLNTSGFAEFVNKISLLLRAGDSDEDAAAEVLK